MISRTAHGALDYIVGVLLLVAPSLLGFSDNEPARNAAYIAGIATLVYSVLTSYELGLVKVIPFRIHLILDIVAGLFLIASPWIMGFADQVVAPHVIVGALEIIVVLATRKAPSETATPHSPITAAR